ncbi:MAG: hypothetical protein B7X57_06855 [Erythrobacter sp. 34-65-8]|nr:MAG: hypothetical protein B7X57_06855 [Erythrobacter sp. 34-65-8]
MRCPFCAHDDSQVKDSRPTEDNTSIRRRRQCDSCGARFTTFERVQLREVVVVKSGAEENEGRREAFDRRKLEQSVALACRKRHERRLAGRDAASLAIHERSAGGLERGVGIGKVGKLEFRKYDPVARKHVAFKEAKIK